jgi:hypothetical protein
MKMRPYETDPAHINIKFYYACVEFSGLASRWASEIFAACLPSLVCSARAPAVILCVACMVRLRAAMFHLFTTLGHARRPRPLERTVAALTETAVSTGRRTCDLQHTI